MRSLILMIVACICIGCASNPPDVPNTPTIIGIHSDAERAEIIRQIDKAHTIGQRHGLGTFPYSKYTVRIVESDPSCINPAFVVQGQCVAGQFMVTEGRPFEIKVVRSLINPVVWYELEHLLAYHFDRVLYERTKLHTATNPNYHPFLGEL